MKLNVFVLLLKKMMIIKKKIKDNKKENDFLSYELNELANFDDILDLDKRTFRTYFVNIFVEKQIFLSTIFNNSL